MTRKNKQFDEDTIRALAHLLHETELSEIEVGDGDRRIRVARQVQAVFAGGMAPAQSGAPMAPAAEMPPAGGADRANDPGAVTSPMVGTVYIASEPGAAPFVEVGSRVDEGQTLMIVEAMKTMNPIRAPKAGTVESILVSDAQPVEYGEPLLILK